MLISLLIMVNLFSYMVLFKTHECSINNGELNIFNSMNTMFLLNTYTIVAISLAKGFPIVFIAGLLLAMFLLYIGFSKLTNILNNRGLLSLKDLSLDLNITLLLFITFFTLVFNLSNTFI